MKLSAVLVLLAGLLLGAATASAQWSPSGASEWTPPDPAAMERMARESLPVAVVSSTVNQKAFLERKLEYRSGVKAWLPLLAEIGVPYRVIGDYELETGIKPASALILHNTDRLSDNQLQNIRAFHEAGGPVIIVGVAGKYNWEGTARSISLPELWLGIQSPRPFVPAEMKSSFFTVRATSPVSLGVDPGYRFEVQWQGSFWLGISDDPATFVTDWGLSPIAGKPQTSTNSLLRVTPKARMAWLGFGPADVVSAGDAEAQVKAYFDTLLRWVLDRPVIARPHWPGGATGAAVITTNIMDEISAEFAALKCYEEQVKATFFVVGKVARERPELMGPLMENGEIANISYYNEEDGTIKGRDVEDQIKELKREVKFLKAAGISEVVGYRPHLGEYDEGTLVAAALSGSKFFFGNSEFDRYWPVQKTLEGMLTIVQFVRPAPDGYGIVNNEGGTTPELYTAALQKHARRVWDLGALFPFIFHVNYQDQETNAASISMFLQWLKEQPVWLTTFGGVLDWIRERDTVAFTLDSLSGGREVTVANPTSAPITGYSLIYVPPSEATQLIENPPFGVTVTPRTPFGYLLTVDLEPYETKRIYLN
jgi:peptidoglycan/xylan/chitin deacetylase (PgdA/CDA1 family)